jgi:glycosyltransferase involved in cell wall biosynthesis
MIPSSAFITVGESASSMAAVAAGRAPSAEYAVLRQNHFTKVVAQVDTGADTSSLLAGAQFAASAYASTWDCRNIYLGEEFPGIQYIALQALLRRPKQIAMLIHNTSSLRRRLPLATLGLGHLASHLLCLSQHSRKELEAKYNIAASRITVVGSRVDTSFFSPDPNARVEAQVCSAGAVNRDYATLIESVAPLGIPLKIAADTAWRYSTTERAHERVPAFVEMRSWGNYENLRDLYASSAVVVVPLAKPILSGITVVLEAMSMGRPVVLTRNSYIEDFVIDGENCLLVDSGNPGALSEKIRYLLDRPEEASRLGKRARDWVLERFTVDKYVKKILSVWN